MMKKLFILIIAFLFISDFGYGLAASGPERQVEKFLTAIQKKDFKTIFDMTYYYQMELAQIKSNNPKALQQKLTTEYYESKKNALFTEKKESFTDAWIRFGGEVFGTSTDPVENIRELMALLTPPNKWKVIESKREKRHDAWSGRELDVSVVYVSLSYKSVEESPLISSKLLKEAILSFVLDEKTGLYLRSSRIKKGDVYWDKVPLKILNVSWYADALFGNLSLKVKVIGGLPPFHSDTKCGEWIIEKLKGANVESWNESVSINLRARIEDKYFPLQCVVSIVDKSGQSATAAFTVPEMFTGLTGRFCWVANPWYQWGQGMPEDCSRIFELRTDTEIQTKASTIPLAKSPSTQLSHGPPEKITIASLTKDIPDADHFVARSKVFNVPFDVVWTAANKYLATQGKIMTSDPVKGIIITEEQSTNFKFKGVALIERLTEDSTNVTIKSFCYKYSTYQIGRQMQSGWERESSDFCSSISLKGVEKEVEKQQKQPPSSSKESSSSQTDDTKKLEAFITDQWKQVIQIPPPKRDWRELVTLKITGKYDDYSSLYLLGVNRRGLANDAFISADRFLKKDDLKNAQKYANLGARHYIESNELFKAADQVFSGSVSITAQTLEALYRGPKEASKYGWFLMCGPKCYEVADYVFLMTDFAVDYGLEGIDEAKKNLITQAFVRTLLKTSGFSKWIENRTTHLIGDSGLYGILDKTINSSEFQRAFMKVVAESGAYTTKEITETGVKTVINNSINFIKGSSNFKPGID